MVTEQEYRRVFDWLQACQRPYLFSHRRPDGDALGALAGCALALRKMGLAPQATLFEPFPPRYAFLQASVSWTLWNNGRKTEAAAARSAWPEDCDAVVILDTCSFSQLEPMAAALPHAPRTLVIDHHATRDDIGGRTEDLRLMNPSAGATCLLLAEWIRAMGIPCGEDMANALFTGIATDCGWFRFSNTDARLLQAAAELVEAGAKPSELHEAIYQQDAPAKLYLIARMLQSLQLYAGGKLAVLALRRRDFQETGADGTMTEDIINEATRLAGTDATILFTEEPDGVTRINLRSKRILDVARLAAQFGGGGHTRAAGARQRGEFDEIAARVVQEAVAALSQEAREP